MKRIFLLLFWVFIHLKQSTDFNIINNFAFVKEPTQPNLKLMDEISGYIIYSNMLSHARVFG